MSVLAKTCHQHTSPIPTVTAKEQLLQELEQISDFLIQEVLGFLYFLELKHPTASNAPQDVTNALHHLQHLGDIGRR